MQTEIAKMSVFGGKCYEGPKTGGEISKMAQVEPKITKLGLKIFKFDRNWTENQLNITKSSDFNIH